MPDEISIYGRCHVLGGLAGVYVKWQAQIASVKVIHAILKYKCVSSIAADAYLDVTARTTPGTRCDAI